MDKCSDLQSATIIRLIMILFVLIQVQTKRKIMSNFFKWSHEYTSFGGFDIFSFAFIFFENVFTSHGNQSFILQRLNSWKKAISTTRRREFEKCNALQVKPSGDTNGKQE